MRAAWSLGQRKLSEKNEERDDANRQRKQSCLIACSAASFQADVELKNGQRVDL
jgi:hypothetical protein